MKKQIIAIAAAMCLVGLSSVVSLAATVEDSGECGENLTWELDSEGTLTISGEGAMDDYFIYHSSNRAPWEDYGVKKLVIEEGVTAIGEYAFSYQQELEDVSIADTVTTIGDSAFQSCTALENVVIPDSVTVMAGSVFLECSNLKSIELSSNLTAIGRFNFYRCTSLQSITIPEGVTSIEENAFEECEALTQVDFPETLTYIGESAFYACSAIEEIDIPEAVTTIEGNAFRACRFKSVYISKNVETIGAFAFLNSYIENIEVDEANPTYCDIDGILFNKDETELLQYAHGKDYTEYKIPDGVTRIADGAFQAARLTDIDIPDSVKTIGNSAFQNCSKITEIHLPDGLEQMGERVFEGSSIQRIRIPDSVTHIGQYGFQNCEALENVVLSNGLEELSDSLFNSCEALEVITIPDNVKGVSRFVFYGCENLKNVYFPKSLEYILNGAFYYSGISEVYYGGSEEEWNEIYISNSILGDDYNELTYTTKHYNTTPVCAALADLSCADGKVTADIVFEHILTDCKGVLAVYDADGRLVDVSVIQAKLNDETAQLSVVAEDAYSYKVFFRTDDGVTSVGNVLTDTIL